MPTRRTAHTSTRGECSNAQVKRKSSHPEAVLQDLSAIAMSLVLLLAPIRAAGADSSSDVAENGYQRTIEVGAKTVEMQLHYGNAAPGTLAVAGEGTVRTEIPGEGQLTLRVPHLVGQGVALGDAQVAARYDLVAEGQLLPSLDLVANIDLPTAPRTREVRPCLKATSAKSVGVGFIEAVRFESELWTDGRRSTPGYRAAIGTTLRFSPATVGNLELVSLRSRIAPGFARESLAQLGLSHRLNADAGLHAGVAARVAGESNSISATIGFDRRF